MNSPDGIGLAESVGLQQADHLRRSPGRLQATRSGVAASACSEDDRCLRVIESRIKSLPSFALRSCSGDAATHRGVWWTCAAACAPEGFDPIVRPLPDRRAKPLPNTAKRGIVSGVPLFRPHLRWP